jgi:hypothetical protein
MVVRGLLGVTLVAVAFSGGCGGCGGCGGRGVELPGASSSQRGPEVPPSPAPSANRRHDASPPAALELAELPVGVGEHAAFAWAERAGHAAYEVARTAEAREDWEAMAAAARDALTADPTHLEAAWLLALARARLGDHEAVLAPLHMAVSGDFGRWGEDSLAHPALTEFLASEPGAVWRAHVELDRARYLQALGRATIVRAGGELFAVDVETWRWFPLTRTGGAVIGALRPTRDRLVYVVRAASSARSSLAVGLIELARGRTTSPVSLATDGPVTIAYSIKQPSGFWIGSGARWRQLVDDGTLSKTSRARGPTGPRLELSASSLQLRSLPGESIAADWDEHGLASALRIRSSSRVVSPPGAALIDGRTVAWSPSRAHLAFVAQPETCTPGAPSAIAYVADAATGTVTELGRGRGGLALVWSGERRLALAGDDGVSIVELDGGPARALVGATDLWAPRSGRACGDEETPDRNFDAPVVEPT